jgi:hypothetical protein
MRFFVLMHACKKEMMRWMLWRMFVCDLFADPHKDASRTLEIERERKRTAVGKC